MNPELLIKLGGVFHLVLALIHLGFWKFLRWEQELAKLMRINRSVVQVLNIQLTYTFVVVASLSLLCAQEMAQTPLGRTVTAGISGFWILRVITHATFFRVGHWLVIAFGLLFLSGALLYGLALIKR